MTDISSQRGSAMMFVMLIGLVISLVFGMFMGSTVVGERRAVEAHLAGSRAYWAEMGHYNYALSRIAASRLCNGCGSGTITDAARATVLQAYLNELNSSNVWTYPDEAAAYSFTMAVAGTVDDTPGRHNYSGWLMMTPTFTGSSVVADLAGKVPLVQLRFCTGLPSSGDKCKKVDEQSGGNATSNYSISRLTNTQWL